mmetsp:Transcript_8904/g.12310  ORF Transcript_8904/g.12310 Transcript_8904/m.12310 type:complete len:170 (-) Transcript_8904:213-722(-)|eukprot:CAMPEP_0185732088 /NCGR_PEP_ID=MMETSP1171-20130828/14933_1 /TAXON_ID=374046 /ORGANISM="Helicotheca tamensis, Strain CCMP826" /LENGTH=169 /DNA_ID=CAMNT_0028401489 /DNA_START=108 /DNA_END=617 /DNA_ORIENTATION=+
MIVMIEQLLLTCSFFATLSSAASFSLSPSFTCMKTRRSSLIHQKTTLDSLRVTTPQQDQPTTAVITKTSLQIGTGFTFEDDEQILVSIQKPLGVILEEYEKADEGGSSGCFVADMNNDGNASNGGVRVGDYLVAVQNMDCTKSTLEEVMDRIGNAPRVVNLRFQRNFEN